MHPTVKSEVQENLTEEELEEMISITVAETETEIVFRIYGTAVNEETHNIDLVKETNDDYLRIKKDHLISDKYMDRAMLTFNNALKDTS